MKNKKDKIVDVLYKEKEKYQKKLFLASKLLEQDDQKLWNPDEVVKQEDNIKLINSLIKKIKNI